MIIILIIIVILVSYYFYNSNSATSTPELSWDNFFNNSSSKSSNKDFIKWVDFKITYEALAKTSKLDIDSHNSDSSVKYNWIELLSYLACKNGGNFKNFNQNDLTKLINKLDSGCSMASLTENLKFYIYYSLFIIRIYKSFNDLSGIRIIFEETYRKRKNIIDKNKRR